MGKLGTLKRGIQGILLNHFEKIPPLPEDLKPRVIGQSKQGNPLECYSLGNGNKKVMLAFGLHGNEVGTVKLGHYLLDHLAKNLEILEGLTILLIPCLNPDGYSIAQKHPDYFGGGRQGRFNGNEVDLNRNFPTKSFKKESAWCFGKNYQERSAVYCGEHGNSEPETQALTHLMLEEKIETLFIFHNCGRDVMPNRNPRAEKIAQQFAKLSGFKYVSHSQWLELNQTGTPKEWCEENNIAFLEVEGSTRWGSDWPHQKEAILQSLKQIAHLHKSKD